MFMYDISAITPKLRDSSALVPFTLSFFLSGVNKGGAGGISPPCRG